MKKDLSFLKGMYIAHRGLYDNDKGIPENSIAAFKRSIREKVAIELDLHILKDNQIVVFHDDNLKRMTGYDKAIKDCTYEEIKNLKLLDTDEKIPLFKDVLRLINGKVMIDIEFKFDNKVGMLEEKASSLLDKYRGQFIVKSFSPATVKWFKCNRPNYIRGQLSCRFKKYEMNPIKKWAMKSLFFNILTKPDFVAYDIRSVTEDQIKKWRKKGYYILLWTIKTKKELEKAKKYADAFVYENSISE